MEFVQQHWQTIAVGICIAAALLYVARATYKRFARNSGQACGGCGSCATSNSSHGASASNIAQLVQIDIKKKTLPT